MKLILKSNQKSNIGGKAARLFELREKGFPVPKLVCVSDIGKAFLAETEQYIKKLVSGNDNTPKAASEIIGLLIDEKLTNIIYESRIVQEIRKALDETVVSVRSSYSLEDSEGYSFAGLFNSYLNVKISDVETYIKLCYSSLFNQNAIAYFRKNKITPELNQMNVIVEKMVEGEISGILFTANPQGLLNESVIVVGLGSGDKVVENAVDVTSHYLNRTDNNCYYEQSSKDSPILNQTTLKKLLTLSDKVKEVLKSEADIEFTISGKKIFLLQARPITTLKNDNTTILDSSNIVESYPNLTLPLTESFVKMVYYNVFKSLAYRCLKNKKLTEKYDHIFRQMLGSANGRIYYKISNWYYLISFLPMSSKIIPIWQDMMGVSNKHHHGKNPDITKFQALKTYVNVAAEFINTPKSMHNLQKEFESVQKMYQQKSSKRLSNMELMRLYDSIVERLLYKWDITLLNDLHAFVYTGIMKKRFQSLGVSNPQLATNTYIGGISGIESMKPIRYLAYLAKIAVSTNKLDILKKLKNRRDAENFINSNSDYAKMLRKYLARYGDRSVEELKLETETFKTAPEKMVEQIIALANSPEKMQSILNQNTHRKSEPTQSLKNVQNFYMEWLKKHARQGIKNRESSRINRCAVYGMARSIFLKLADNFVRDGVLQDKKEIFWLTLDEVFAVCRGEESGLKFSSIIKKRKEEYAIYEQLPMYSRLIFSGKEFDKKHRSVNSISFDFDSKVLRGIPCSNGIITGEVMVINHPSDIDINAVKDKILVTKTTDPGWVFLISTARGIISEKGSILSHTAIISRELKIPAVVGVNDITKILKNGEIITLDADKGVIIRNVSANKNKRREKVYQ